MKYCAHFSLSWGVYMKMKDIIRNGESCLRWFGHVHSKVINAPVRMSELIQVEGTESRGRPKITLIVVKNDMSIKKIRESMISNRIKWQKIILVGNPN